MKLNFTQIALITLITAAHTFSSTAFAVDREFPSPIILCDAITTQQGYPLIITVSTDVNGPDAASAATLISGDMNSSSREVKVVLGELVDDETFGFSADTKYTKLSISIKDIRDPKKTATVVYKTKNFRNNTWTTQYDGIAACGTRQYESIGAHN